MIKYKIIVLLSGSLHFSHNYDLQITFIMFIFVMSNVTIMNTRLKQFISAENITQAQLADTINVVRASVSHILAGRNKPSYEFISGLMRHYPMLNIEWLMFGKGKMYKDNTMNTDLFNEVPEELSERTEMINTESVNTDSTYELPSEPPIPVQQTVPVTQMASLSDIKTLINESQKPVVQRKLIKITAFFDDGTFQELTTL